ncbi:hypothetical protein CEXT_222991 [Caerostris extrusa]|uniref:Uncharacterized protein n=1 Tax=Caerostris extrusa TaxID=172846 RepID=A0AAV4U742_CAEEX|nr:hypothetical protein CEXT_222991 [Caerostris extrusa]
MTFETSRITIYTTAMFVMTLAHWSFQCYKRRNKYLRLNRFGKGPAFHLGLVPHILDLLPQGFFVHLFLQGLLPLCRARKATLCNTKAILVPANVT